MSNVNVLLGLNEDAAFMLLGVPATYMPSGGTAQTITVIPRQPDAVLDLGDSKIRSETTLFEVRASEVASPAKGGTIAYPVGGTTYTISSTPTRDVRRRLWKIETTK